MNKLNIDAKFNVLLVRSSSAQLDAELESASDRRDKLRDPRNSYVSLDCRSFILNVLIRFDESWSRSDSTREYRMKTLFETLGIQAHQRSSC